MSFEDNFKKSQADKILACYGSTPKSEDNKEVEIVKSEGEETFDGIVVDFNKGQSARILAAYGINTEVLKK